jgi:hypothetical protein
MSELLEIVLNLVLDFLPELIGCLFDGWLTADTLASRIFWSVILLFVSGLIWWELH